MKGQVGPWKFEWKSIPHGISGEVTVLASGPGGAKAELTLRWKKDARGIWLELPDGVKGYDLIAQQNDEGSRVFSVLERGASGEWSGLSWTRGEAVQGGAAGAQVKKAARVRAQMPGKILRLHVQAGSIVQKDQPLAVMEAMKMENEIRAPHAGKIGQLKVSEGQAVETGADLFIIDPVV